MSNCKHKWSLEMNGYASCELCQAYMHGDELLAKLEAKLESAKDWEDAARSWQQASVEAEAEVERLRSAICEHEWHKWDEADNMQQCRNCRLWIEDDELNGSGGDE